MRSVAATAAGPVSVAALLRSFLPLDALAETPILKLQTPPGDPGTRVSARMGRPTPLVVEAPTPAPAGPEA